MRSKGCPRVVAAALTAALAAAGMPACTDRAPVPPQAQSSATAEPVDETLSGESILDLDVDLIDNEGRRLKLADLGGQLMVAAMVYTSCTTVCIMITEEMKRIERQLAGADRDVRYVLFSLDPGRDTPAAMRAFADAHRLDTTRWRLLAASEDGVRDLAAVLGVKYRREENGEIAHSAMIFVIDRHGVVRHRQVGVGQDPAILVSAVARARG